MSRIFEETTTITRTYYYDIQGEIVPDHESMLAYLIDEDILFSGNSYDNNTATLYININDYFAPAADAEKLPHSDIPKLFEMYRENKYDGVAQYVADKRGIPNKRWRDKYSAFQNSLRK
jgi:hypothetical protein